MQKKVVIVDFGSQYTQLIARRVRELGVYSEVHPFSQMQEQLPLASAVILAGSPFSSLDPNGPRIDFSILDESPVPLLGICYGAQLFAQTHEGEVQASAKREYGRSTIQIVAEDELFAGFENDSTVWMSHGDHIEELPDNFSILASTASIPVAAFRYDGRGAPTYGIQFHPEVSHTEQGKALLSNFLIKISGCATDWTPASFVDEAVSQIRDQVGDQGEVLLGLSGGVDSTVAAGLLQRAIGDRLHSFFVDTGLMRKGEFEEVMEHYKKMGVKVHGIQAGDRFLSALDGVSDPEAKRKIIGNLFIEIFEEEAKRFSSVQFLGQGTIYPDVIESVSVHGPSVTIKSHHNVGGLPEKFDLDLVEPLRMLFKDEVRKVGAELSIPHQILGRHPFPGPGLAIRILGAITQEKVKILQEADSIYINALREAGLYDNIWQAGAILLPVKSVGVMGDERSYEFTLALRAVQSIDGMTADWSQLPYDLLGNISNKIINNVKGINRVVYDISSKPPATIEWE